MSNLTAVVNNIISKVNTHTTDLSNKTTQIATHISGIASYHLLQGNLAVSNYTTTQGFNTTLYTGNGSTQSITTGIDMSTQWGNTAEEKFGGLVWVKGRSTALNHSLYDTVRGATKLIASNVTNAESTVVSGLTAFSSTGFSLGSQANENTSAATQASWNFQTTHRVTGTTNHGQAYECHYNPFTGFTMVKYTGSGLAGHEIPHHLGRKLGFVTVKNLSSSQGWIIGINTLKGAGFLQLNLTDAFTAQTDIIGNWFPTALNTENTICSGANNIIDNTSSNTYIMYGWANSYFDKANKLIGNYEIGVYQGTGAAGNKVSTRGKPAWIMLKRLDSTGNWEIFDNLRNGIPSGNDSLLYTNLSTAEATTANRIDFLADGFTLMSVDTDNNATGSQYIALVAYDTNSNGGGSYYPLASDTANVQVNNALIPIAQGIDSNGAKNTILSKNETFSGVTYTQGKNYPYYDALGNRGVSAHKPRYLESELVRTYAGESPDYFSVKENKWYSTNSGSELVTNGTFTSNVSGWTNGSGTATNVNGTLQVNGYTYWVYQDIAVQIGKQYSFSFKYMNGGSNSSVSVGTATELATYPYGVGSLVNSVISPSTSGTSTFKFTPNTSTIRIAFAVSSSGAQVLNIDNVTLFETTITPTTEITNGRNYLNHIVYADNDGGVLYVEELPKIEYKDIIKANEFKGKNACTALISAKCDVIPASIENAVNFSAVVRTATGSHDFYFNEPMDNLNYEVFCNFNISGAVSFGAIYSKFLNKVSITTIQSNGVLNNPTSISISIFGGKN